LFTIELTAKIVLLGRAFFKQALNYLDLFVVTMGLLDWLLGSTQFVSSTMMRLVRLTKLSRGLRVIHITKVMESLHMLLTAMQASISTLFWSFVVLAVIQCIAGMTLSQLLQPWLNNEDIDPAKRRRVYRYYGTFTHTTITMFEIHLANWAPACRVLIDEVSEWYGLFFIIYRCLAGFAVLNVINAVFIQQTMKVAQSSIDIMIFQKQKQQEQYKKRLKEVFKQIDTSGDGRVTQMEIESVMHDSKMKTWLACLDIDVNDLYDLFEMFDDGDGKLTIGEFLSAATRMKGNAKNIDMARLLSKVTKLEEQLDSMGAMVADRRSTNSQSQMYSDS